MSTARVRKTAPDYRRALYTCPHCRAEQAQSAAVWTQACTTGIPVLCGSCGQSIDAVSVTYAKEGGNYFGET